jgi:hypothetical protein
MKVATMASLLQTGCRKPSRRILSSYFLRFAAYLFIAQVIPQGAIAQRSGMATEEHADASRVQTTSSFSGSASISTPTQGRSGTTQADHAVRFSQGPPAPESSARLYHHQHHHHHVYPCYSDENLCLADLTPAPQSAQQDSSQDSVDEQSYADQVEDTPDVGAEGMGRVQEIPDERNHGMERVQEIRSERVQAMPRIGEN